MSQHPSLRGSDKDKAQRSVLKRYERIKILKDHEKWGSKDSIYGLEKVKIVKFKAKKEKAAKADDAAAAPGAEAPGAKVAPSAAAKPAAGAAPKKPAK